MKIIVAIFVGLLIHSGGAIGGVENPKPTGKNCNLASPPPDAGEETNHGLVFRIYPRKKDIDASYTGCQALLGPDGDKWAVISLTEVANGDPLRIWFPDDPAAEPDVRAMLLCRYERGKIVRGNPHDCWIPDMLLIRSMAAGCVERNRQATKASRVMECAYQ